jgi:hypothetical protein
MECSLLLTCVSLDRCQHRLAYELTPGYRLEYGIDKSDSGRVASTADFGLVSTAELYDYQLKLASRHEKEVCRNFLCHAGSITLTFFYYFSFYLETFY